MPKQAVVKWNTEQLSSIKRDLLLFDGFFYDPYLLKLQVDLLRNVAKLLNYDTHIIEEIQATVNYFESKKLLKPFSIQAFKAGKVKLLKLSRSSMQKIIKEVSAYDRVHKDFLDKYNKAVDLLQKNQQSGILKYISLLDEFRIFADYHVRLTSCLIQNSRKGLSITPIIDSPEKIEKSREVEVIHLVVNKLPIPDKLVPYDEIIDFKFKNEKKYRGLIQWINRITKTEFNIGEIEDELMYYTVEFEEALKLEKAKYQISNLEIVISLPFEVAEKLIKLKWSQIPKSIISIRKNKIDLLISESKLPGKEVAYITYANKEFAKSER